MQIYFCKGQTVLDYKSLEGFCCNDFEKKHFIMRMTKMALASGWNAVWPIKQAKTTTFHRGAQKHAKLEARQCVVLHSFPKKRSTLLALSVRKIGIAAVKLQLLSLNMQHH